MCSEHEVCALLGAAAAFVVYLSVIPRCKEVLLQKIRRPKRRNMREAYLSRRRSVELKIKNYRDFHTFRVFFDVNAKIVGATLWATTSTSGVLLCLHFFRWQVAHSMRLLRLYS